jgi:hypothetical protein
VLAIIIGGAFSYVIYRWQRRDKRPRYSLRNVIIVRNAKSTFPTLTVHYKGVGENLDNLSVAVVVVWNDGRETIDGKDITTADPLAIVASGDVRILGASVIGGNNLPSKPRCDFVKAENRVLITFDYLDYGHGLVLEVLHTGTADDAISVQGTFKGCGKISYRNTQAYPFPLGNSTSRRRLHPPSRARRLGGIAMMVLAVVLSPLVFVAGFLPSWSNSRQVVEVEGKPYMPVSDYW